MLWSYPTNKLGNGGGLLDSNACKSRLKLICRDGDWAGRKLINSDCCDLGVWEFIKHARRPEMAER